MIRSEAYHRRLKRMASIARAIQLVESASEALTLVRADRWDVAELLAAVDRTRQHAHNLRSLLLQPPGAERQVKVRKTVRIKC